MCTPDSFCIETLLILLGYLTNDYTTKMLRPFDLDTKGCINRTCLYEGRSGHEECGSASFFPDGDEQQVR